MRKKLVSAKYYFTIENISEGEQTGYMAVVPAFNNSLVFGDSLTELEEGLEFLIQSEIEELEKKGKAIPAPDAQKRKRSSGKFMLRINPHLHTKIKNIAKANNKSLNGYIAECLEKKHAK